MIAAEFDALSAELSAAPLDETVRRRAALVACAQAQDVDDARELLEALGLVSRPAQPRRCTDVRRPRQPTCPRSAISPTLAAELRAAHEADSRGRSRARPAPPRPRPDHNLHGHMVGIDRHLRSGSLLCARCQDLFDDLIAAGILREATP